MDVMEIQNVGPKLSICILYMGLGVKSIWVSPSLCPDLTETKVMVLQTK